MLETILEKYKLPRDFHLPSVEVALRRAAAAGKINDIRGLLPHIKNINAADAKQQRTALHWAAIKRHLNIFALLLQAGANGGIADADGKCVLDYVEMPEFQEWSAEFTKSAEEFTKWAVVKNQASTNIFSLSHLIEDAVAPYLNHFEIYNLLRASRYFLPNTRFANNTLFLSRYYQSIADLAPYIKSKIIADDELRDIEKLVKLERAERQYFLRQKFGGLIDKELLNDHTCILIILKLIPVTLFKQENKDQFQRLQCLLSPQGLQALIEKLVTIEEINSIPTSQLDGYKLSLIIGLNRAAYYNSGYIALKEKLMTFEQMTSLPKEMLAEYLTKGISDLRTPEGQARLERSIVLQKFEDNHPILLPPPPLPDYG